MRLKNSDIVGLAVSALIYYLLARFGMVLFSLEPSNITLLWLPSGLALIMCLQWGYRAFPFIVLASFAANFPGMAASPGNAPVLHTSIMAIADGMAGILAMHSFKHFLPNGLTRTHDLAPFGLWVCLFPTAITSIILSTDMATGGYIRWDDFGYFVGMLILADSLGILLVYQVYQGWRDDRRMSQGEMRWLGEGVLVMVVFLVLGITVLPGMAYFIPALLLVLAFNIGMNGVATLSALSIIGIVVATAHNLGPFVAADPMDSNFELMAFSFASALTILGVTLQRRQLISADLLRESEALLREAQLVAGLGNYTLEIPTGQWKRSDVLDGLLGIDAAYPPTLAGWLALIHPDDRTMVADYLENEVIGQGRNFDREFRIVRRNDQATRWLHGLGKLEYDGQGRPLKLLGTVQDVTNRKQSEIDLRQAKETVEYALTEQHQFMDMLTHELKTPISVVRMALGAMKVDGLLKRHADHALEDMSDIVERCRQMDQIEQNKLPLHVQACRIEDILSGLRLTCGAPNRLSITSDGVTDIATDPQLLRIVIGNLISNAVKYSEPETVMDVHLEPSLHDGKAGVRMTIENQPGTAGLPDPEQLFIKYYRSPGAHGKTGSGLGLYLVRNITQLLGGRVSYDVVQGKARFALWIPS